MKKLLCILLSIMLIFAFAACGGDSTAELDETLTADTSESADSENPADEEEIEADDEEEDEDFASDSDINPDDNYNYEAASTDSNLTTDNNTTAVASNSTTDNTAGGTPSKKTEDTPSASASTSTASSVNGNDYTGNTNGTGSTASTTTTTTTTTTGTGGTSTESSTSTDSDLNNTGSFVIKYHANTSSFNSGVDVDSTVTGIPTDNTQYTATDNQAYVMGNNTVSSVTTNHYGTMIDGTPTWSGHTFSGWSTSAASTIAQYQPGTTMTVSGNMDLYAVWTVAAVDTSTTATTTTTPQTGENDYLFLYTILALFTLGGMIYLLIDQKRAGRKN